MVCLPKARSVSLWYSQLSCITIWNCGCSDGKWVFPDRILIFSDSFEEAPWGGANGLLA